MYLGTSGPTDILQRRQDMISEELNPKYEDSFLSQEGVSGEVTFNAQSLIVVQADGNTRFLSGF